MLVATESPSSLIEEEPEFFPEENKIEPGIVCAENLLVHAGRKAEGAEPLLSLFSRASRVQDTEFLMYVLSIIYVESRFNRDAVSSMDARGLMQMTAIAVEDATRHCESLKPLNSIDKLHDSYTNLKYGTCYLSKLHGEMEGDWTRTLIVYNGGYRALQKYDRGENLPTETANYVLKVNRVLNTICTRQPEKK